MLNNITTDKVYTNELTLKDVNINRILKKNDTPGVIIQDTALVTYDFMKDFVDHEDDNYAKLNKTNIFTEKDDENNDINNTFNGQVYVNKILSSSSGHNLNISSGTNIINLGSKQTLPTIINTTSNIDTLTTDNLEIRNDAVITNDLAVDNDLTVTNDVTINNNLISKGDVTLGKKQTNQTTLITSQKPGSSPAEYVDTFTTDNIITDSIKILNTGTGFYNDKIEGIIGTSDATYTSDNDKLITKGYIDELTKDLNNYAKVNASNVFLAKDADNNDLVNTFNGDVKINKLLTSDNNKDLNIKSGTNTINLNEKTNIITTGTTGAFTDTLTTDIINTSTILNSNGNTLLLGNKSNNKTSLTIDTTTNKDTFTTDNLTAEFINTTSISNSSSNTLLLGNKSTNKTSLVYDTETTKDTFSTDIINVSTTLNSNGDNYFGKKTSNKSSLISHIIPDTEPTEYKDTFTTDNVIINDTLTINGDLDANLPNNYNFAIEYDLENHYYTYNNVNYKLNNNEFNVIGFRNNKNNTFIIEPYLLIKDPTDNTKLIKYIVNNFDDTEFNYEVNNINTYIYFPDTFEYDFIASLINLITKNSSFVDLCNLYVSCPFKYKLSINYNTSSLSILSDFKIYYIIRNSDFEIDLNNNQTHEDLPAQYNFKSIGQIYRDDNLIIINLANFDNAFLGIMEDSNCNNFITSNVKLLKNNIIESHYNMYLNMANNKLNYLQKKKYNNYLYIKQFNNVLPDNINYLYIYNLLNEPSSDQPESEDKSAVKYYAMNNKYYINWIGYYSNKIYIFYGSYYLPSSSYQVLEKAIGNYSNYTHGDLKYCYLINNKIYLLFVKGTNTSLLVFDIDDFTFYKTYVFDDYYSKGLNNPNNIVFNYNKEIDDYELYTLINDNNEYQYYQLNVMDDQNNEHSGKLYYYDLHFIVNIDNNENIIDNVYVKPYNIILTKDTNNKYKIYYSQNIKSNYWQFYNINLNNPSLDEYKFTMLDVLTFDYYTNHDEIIIPKLYIIGNNGTASSPNYIGAEFGCYTLDTLLMRI